MQVSIRGRKRHFRTVSFDEAKNETVLIDQRLLPHHFELLRTRDYRETALAIRDMAVRGAGAIGATAAYGLAQGVRAIRTSNAKIFEKETDKVFTTLKEARPTAVDPVNAMLEIRRRMAGAGSIQEAQEIALRAAEDFATEDVDHCREIGVHGSGLIKEGMKVLTHCNAGWLAFVDIGTATAPLYQSHSEGRNFFVYCDETRPRCQGASLTAWELGQQGVPHAVIADNAAGHLMQRGQIDLVIVGSDRVLGRTGDVANKIGTYTKAVLAKRHKIPFYVAIPLSTLDWELGSGLEIPIEERSEAEVLSAWGVDKKGVRTQVRIAAPGSNAVNPGFDVTPGELVTGIITPKGIFRPGELWRKRRELGWKKM